MSKGENVKKNGAAKARDRPVVKKANPLEQKFKQFCKKLSNALGKPVGTGEFGADMKVSLINDGPVTILFDTDIWRKNENYEDIAGFCKSSTKAIPILIKCSLTYTSYTLSPK